MTLPPDLIDEYDDIAEQHTRSSRAQVMEIALREWAAQWRAKKAET